MTKPEPGRSGEPETTILHLSRFAPGATEQAGTGVVASETELVYRAAAETVAGVGATTPVVVPRTAAPLAPDELLGAVAYCYVKGVFSSADIERKMLRDPEFREALDGVVPDPATIQRFRRLNRAAIQTALEKFYAHLRRQQKIVRGALPGVVPATPAGDLPRASRPEENTAIFVKREASERLDKATFIDHMSDF